MAEFGAAAELSVSLAPGEAAAIRSELEDELGDIGVGASGGAAGALGSGGGSALTDGGLDTVAGQLADQTDLLEDILDELETGGRGPPDAGPRPLLPFLASAASSGASGAASGAAGLLSRLMKSSTLRAIATGGASVTGGVAAPVLTPGAVKGSVDFVKRFTGGDPKGPDAAEAPGAQGGRAPLSPFNFVDAASTFFGRPDAPTDSELPGTITRETIRQNRRQGDTPFTESDIGFQTGGSIPEPTWLDDLRVDRPPWLDELGLPDRAISGQGSETTTRFGEELGAGQRTGNRAAEQRQQRGGGTDVTVDVTVERPTRRELQQAIDEAKRKAVKEVERQVSQSGAVITR